MLYVSTTPKGESKGLLIFVVPTAHRQTALNGVHRDAGHQGQERTIALAQEHFWWPRMVNDCHALVGECHHCKIFKGALVKAPLCPI